MESNIKGLVSAGHEMASELKAECGAVDMRSVAKLISDLATQLEVQLVRANAQAEDQQKAIESIKQADSAVKLAHEKFSALAAENAMLKQRTQQLIDIISNTDNDYCMCGSAMKDHVHSGCGYPTGMFDYYYNQWLESDNKTPATDAFLAEVRAQGVEMMREHPSIKLCSLTHICDEFAAQLRKGGNQ
ncbi:eae-like domain protein [Escherichia coli]